MEASLLDYLKEYENVLLPIITFVLGFIVSRFTLSLKERKDYEQKLFENGKALMESQQARFQEFSTTLQKYINKDDEPTLDDFFDIATVGEKYFYQLKISSDAILTGKVESTVRDNSLVPGIKEAVNISLPAYYTTLQIIAQKKNIVYEGELRRENYESMYVVVEKYARL